MGLLSNWIAKRGLGALWGAWKWKIVIAAAIIAVGYVTSLHIMLRITRADLRAANSELVLVRNTNEANVRSIGTLEKANQEWARQDAMSADRLATLKKEAEDAQRTAERIGRELASRRELDRKSPDCAALLDRSFAVCPDVRFRLKERQEALDAYRNP